MKDDRDWILDNLGKTVLPPAPPPPAPPPSSLSEGGRDALIAAFTQSARNNQATCVPIDALAALPSAVATFLQERALPQQVVCEESLLDLAWQQVGIDAVYRRPQDADTCGVTRMTAAAADTGAMLLTDAADAALMTSLLPPHHIAVLNADDIVADLAALLRRLPQPLPATFNLIGGPSRTADIEQTLTLGAHGPVAVCIALVL